MKKLINPCEVLWVLYIVLYCMHLVLSADELGDLNNKIVPATHEEVHVKGSVFCEQCFHGSLAVIDQLKTPLAGAQVMLQCNSSNEAGLGTSEQSIAVTNKKGSFKISLSSGYYHKNGAVGCWVRLLQSPDAKCTISTDVKRVTDGYFLSDQHPKYSSKSKLIYLVGELSFKPEKPSAASCKRDLELSVRKRQLQSVSGKNKIQKKFRSSFQSYFVDKHFIFPPFPPLILPPLPPLIKPPPFPFQLPPFPPLPTFPPFPFPLPPHHPFPGHPIPPSSPPSPTIIPPIVSVPPPSPPAPIQPSPYSKPPVVPTTPPTKPPLPPLVPTKPPLPPLVPTKPPLPPVVPTKPPTIPSLPPVVPTKPPLPPSSHPLPPLPPHHPLPGFPPLPPHSPIVLPPIPPHHPLPGFPPLPPHSPIVLPPIPHHPLPHSPPSPSLPKPLPPPSPPKTKAPPSPTPGSTPRLPDPYHPSPPSPPYSH